MLDRPPKLDGPPEVEPPWQIPASDPLLVPDTAHVWRADLDDATQLCQWERYLSSEEKTRATHLRFALDRQRFMAARGLLRELLGFYTNTNPAQLRFGYNSHGKPFLREPTLNRLFFNISHSGGKALFVLASAGEVGIDIERVRDRVDPRAVTTALCTPEQNVLLALSERDLPAAFFKFWTRKEAYAKADGRGLARSLRHLNVSHFEDAGWSRALVWHQESSRWCQDTLWHLRTLEVGSGHVAAVAAQVRPRQIACWLWNG